MGNEVQGPYSPVYEIRANECSCAARRDEKTSTSEDGMLIGKLESGPLLHWPPMLSQEAE